MKLLIIIVTIIALSAVIGSIIVGEKVFDGIVVEKPYEQGLLWDRIQADKAALGWSAVVGNKKFKTGDNELGISIYDRNGKPLANASVSILISRPSTNVYDKDYRMAKLHDGTYRAAVNFPLHGYWDLKINVVQNEKHATLEERVFAEKYMKTIGHGNVQATFDINPKPVKPMSELLFSITLKEGERPVTDAGVSLDLTMPGMFMGVNRPVLKHVKDGRYEGTGILPKCPHGGKKWKAEVTIVRDGATETAGYIFEVR